MTRSKYKEARLVTRAAPDRIFYRYVLSLFRPTAVTAADYLNAREQLYYRPVKSCSPVRNGPYYRAIDSLGLGGQTPIS